MTEPAHTTTPGAEPDDARVLRVRVDRTRCNGFALCHAVAPDVYQVDDTTGYNEMGEFAAPAVMARGARRGAAACPEHAITVDDTLMP